METKHYYLLNTLEKKCAKLIPNVKINFAFRKTNTLKSIFLPLQKGKDVNRADCKIIYKIACKDCDSIYIGETSRDKKTRMKEHQNNIKNMDHNFKIY
jgi:putative NIF3 family GTP cyclohydrolase 1 type 2